MVIEPIAEAPASRGGWHFRLPQYYGWVIVAVGFLTVSAARGTFAAFGVLLVVLGESLGWSRTVTAGAFGLHGLAWALSAAPLGALLDRFGPRRVFSGAALVAAAGLLLVATTREPWQLYLGVGLLTGVGFTPLGVNNQGVVVAQWFVRRRGLAAGIMGAGTGFGVLVLGPLTQWLIGQVGWQGACMTLAALFGLGIAPLAALLQRFRPAELGLQADGDGPLDGRNARSLRAAVADGPRVADALRQPRFWALGATCLIGNVPVYFLLAHQVAHLVQVGFAPAHGAMILGLGGAATIAGMVLWGRVADRWSGEWAYSAGSVVLAASLGLIALVTPDRDYLLLPFAVLYGIGTATRMGLTTFMTAALVAGPSLGTLMGVITFHTALGVGLGPALGGWVFDATGSYHAMFAISGVCAAAAVGGVWLAAPRRGTVLRAAASG